MTLALKSEFSCGVKLNNVSDNWKENRQNHLKFLDPQAIPHLKRPIIICKLFFNLRAPAYNNATDAVVSTPAADIEKKAKKDKKRKIEEVSVGEEIKKEASEKKLKKEKKKEKKEKKKDKQ